MAGKCSILAVLNVLVWAVCGLEQGGIPKELAKRLQGMEDRMNWLTTEHRNMSTTLTKVQRRLHNTHRQMNEILEEDIVKEKLISDMRDQLSKQNGDIESLKKDNANLKGVIKQLTEVVQELRGGLPLGTTASPLMKTTKSTIPSTPRDCEDVYQRGGMNFPGNYYITVKPESASESFKVCCQMTNTSGWTMLMRRMDGSVDFFRKWDEYKRGFGNLEAEFWLGNDKIHQITSQGDYELRIEMETWEGKKYYAEYDHFRVSSEKDLYRLHVSNYHGNAGDSLTSYWEDHNNQPFSTRDQDNDDRFYDNCAEHYRGGWWFKSCFESHLNGVYYKKGQHNNYFVRNGILWNSIHLHSSLKYAAMLVKPSTKTSDPTSRNDTVD